jgi:hypothetical protein
MQTISEEYRELNRKMHESRASYGVSGHYHAPLLLRGAREYGVGAVLDYGCGKGTLAPVLRTNGLECFEYDPAIPGKDTPPAPADMVYSGDVAEHVEPEYLDAYLDDLRRLTKKVVVLLIATRPAKKTLADGRNAHLIQEPLEWWLPKLAARFQMTQLLADPEGFSFVGTPLPLGDTA